MRTFWTARCTKMTQMRPSTACDTFHSSKNHCAACQKGWKGHNTNKAYQELEECEQADDAEEVSDEGHHRPELRVSCVEKRAEEEREHEQHQKDSGVPHNRSERNDGDANEGARWLASIAVRERLDEHVAHDDENRHHDREDDLGENDCAPSRTRHVAGQLLGWVP